MRSFYLTHAIRRAASLAVGAATLAADENLRTFKRAVRMNLAFIKKVAVRGLDSDFVPLAIDTLGTPAEPLVASVQYYARRISMQFANTAVTVAARIWQKLGVAVWSSVALAILARMPV